MDVYAFVLDVVAHDVIATSRGKRERLIAVL